MRSRWLALTSGLCVSLASAAASAAITIVEQDVNRTVSDRSDDQFPFYVSYADCKSKDEFRFPLNITGSVDSAETMEVWVGRSEDCTFGDSRTGEGVTCRQIATVPLTNFSGTVLNVNVAASKIAQGIGVENCEDTTGSTGANEVTIYFMIIDAPEEDVPADRFALWNETAVDLLGPPAPTAVTTKGGENGLTVEWDQTESSDVKGFNIYCSPAADPLVSGSGGAGGGTGGTAASTGPGGAGGGGGSGGGGTAGMGGMGGMGGAGGMMGTGGAGGAVTGGAGGMGGATGGDGGKGGGGDGGSPGQGGAAASGDCAASDLTPGQRPEKETCGETGKSSNGLAGGLQNGVRYAVGVAARDAVGNVGFLSGLSCGIPEPLDDFYELYRRYGGEAGGGFCDCALPGVPASGWSAVLAAIGLAAAAGARRGIRRKR